MHERKQTLITQVNRTYVMHSSTRTLPTFLYADRATWRTPTIGILLQISDGKLDMLQNFKIHIIVWNVLVRVDLLANHGIVILCGKMVHFPCTARFISVSLWIAQQGLNLLRRPDCHIDQRVNSFARAKYIPQLSLYP